MNEVELASAVSYTAVYNLGTISEINIYVESST